MRSGVVSNRGSFNSAEVALTAATIFLSITVQNFLPESALRCPYAVIVPWGRCEVAGGEDNIACRAPSADEADDTVLDVPTINPLEAHRREVQLVQCWLASIHVIQILHPPLQA